MTTAAPPLFNLKINMDKLVASSSLCSEGDDNDDIVSTPTPASPSALASRDIAAKEDDELFLPTTTSVADMNEIDEVDCAKPSTSYLNGSNSKRNSSSLLSHNNKIRLLYFFFRFSTGALVPFMSLYMQHVGLRPDQIGTLQAIRPIVTMTSAPLWGGLADRTGKKKLVLMVSSNLVGSISTPPISPHHHCVLSSRHTLFPKHKGNLSFQLHLSALCMFYIKQHCYIWHVALYILGVLCTRFGKRGDAHGANLYVLIPSVELILPPPRQ